MQNYVDIPFNHSYLQIHNKSKFWNLQKPLYYNVPSYWSAQQVQKRRDSWALRIKEEIENSGLTQFITLTINQENLTHLPFLNNLFATFEYKRVQKLMHDIRQWLYRHYGITNGVKYLIASEYGEKKYRPHYHLILHWSHFAIAALGLDNDYQNKRDNTNLSLPSWLLLKIQSLWNYGFICPSPLMGDDHKKYKLKYNDKLGNYTDNFLFGEQSLIKDTCGCGCYAAKYVTKSGIFNKLPQVADTLKTLEKLDNEEFAQIHDSWKKFQLHIYPKTLSSKNYGFSLVNKIAEKLGVQINATYEQLLKNPLDFKNVINVFQHGCNLGKFTKGKLKGADKNIAVPNYVKRKLFKKVIPYGYPKERYLYNYLGNKLYNKNGYPKKRKSRSTVCFYNELGQYIHDYNINMQITDLTDKFENLFIKSKDKLHDLINECNKLKTPILYITHDKITDSVQKYLKKFGDFSYLANYYTIFRYLCIGEYAINYGSAINDFKNVVKTNRYYHFKSINHVSNRILYNSNYMFSLLNILARKEKTAPEKVQTFSNFAPFANFEYLSSVWDLFNSYIVFHKRKFAMIQSDNKQRDKERLTYNITEYD